MKFKITGKDLTIFCVFAVFLLYLCAIAVLNVLTLINDGVFYGLNPIEAFTPKYLPGTLVIFIGVLASIFFSVSASIFDHEKGFGFGISLGEKEDKGYSRWLKEYEMKKAWKIFKVGVKDVSAEHGGVVFINDGKQMWVDDSENHTLVIGVTGSGKTTAVVDPLVYSLCKSGESMVFTDPKGEIYKNHAELLKARGYKIVMLNFRNPNLGNSWNPLTLPYRLYKEGNVDKTIELVDDVGNNILKDKGGNNDPFWQNSASDYFSGCALGLIQDAKEEEVNLNSISSMTTIGEEKFGAGSTYIKEYFTMKGENSSAYVFASNTINSPTETKGGILSTFRQKIRLFASREQLSEMLSYSDFNMRDIGKEKTAVFLTIHDEKTTYHALATIFIKQCYETLIDVAQECGGKLPVRTNFILDEFANMPALKDVTTMVTAARSRAIRFTFIIQNFAQLNEVYGKEDAETIRSNCGNLMYLLTTELAALEEISKLCGEIKSKDKDKTASTPLITVADLQKMKLNEVIILRNRYHPFRTKLKQGFSTDWGDKEFGKAEFVQRETRPIQIFDIKEFVKLRKKSSLGLSDDKSKGPGMTPKESSGLHDFSNMMSGGNNSINGSNPFGGNTSVGRPNPFVDNDERPSAPRIPSFEEFMAQRNGGQAPSTPRQQLPTFDVDDLVKRIDAKIAELEAQEKAEEEAKNNSSKPVTSIPVPPVDNLNTTSNSNAIPVVPEIIKNNSSEIKNEDIFKPAVDSPIENVIPVIPKTPEIKEPMRNISELNPFNSMKNHEEDDLDKFNLADTNVKPDNIETKPAASNFSSMINSNVEMPMMNSTMITNPIDTKTEVPKLPEEPIIAPPLGGIMDPTKMYTSSDFEKTNSTINKEIVKDSPVNTIKEIPKASVQPINTVKPVVINTNQQATNVKVDTDSKVINPISDDEFFDDFFDE